MDGEDPRHDLDVVVAATHVIVAVREDVRAVVAGRATSRCVSARSAGRRSSKFTQKNFSFALAGGDFG